MCEVHSATLSSSEQENSSPFGPSAKRCTIVLWVFSARSRVPSVPDHARMVPSFDPENTVPSLSITNCTIATVYSKSQIGLQQVRGEANSYAFKHTPQCKCAVRQWVHVAAWETVTPREKVRRKEMGTLRDGLWHRVNRAGRGSGVDRLLWPGCSGLRGCVHRSFLPTRCVAIEHRIFPSPLRHGVVLSGERCILGLPSTPSPVQSGVDRGIRPFPRAVGPERRVLCLGRCGLCFGLGFGLGGTTRRAPTFVPRADGLRSGVRRGGVALGLVERRVGVERHPLVGVAAAVSPKHHHRQHNQGQQNHGNHHRHCNQHPPPSATPAGRRRRGGGWRPRWRGRGRRSTASSPR
eukprot:m.105344 g.105344  ORF g.105344 m.105344 type:complete len:350 (-) comp12643_c0_seq1:843-1892(-)